MYSAAIPTKLTQLADGGGVLLCPLRSVVTPEAPLETFLMRNKYFLFCSPIEKVRGYK
jgi:hypothetical protein